MCTFCMKAVIRDLCDDPGEGSLGGTVGAHSLPRPTFEPATVRPVEIAPADDSLAPLDQGSERSDPANDVTPGTDAPDTDAQTGAQTGAQTDALVPLTQPVRAETPAGSDAPALSAEPPAVFASSFAPGDVLFTGLDSGFRMDSGIGNASGQMIVTYAFAPQGFLISGSGFSFNADTNWTAYEESRISAAMDLFGEVLNIEFTEVANVASADMKFSAGITSGASSTEFGSTFELGFAFFPGGLFASNIASSVFLNTDGFGWDRNAASGDSFDNGLEEGGLGFLTILHEIGHALGLDHTFESGFSTMFPGLVDDFSGPFQDQPGSDGVADDPFNDTGSFGLNQDTYSVMSYRTGWTDHPLGAARFDLTKDQSGSLMALDIAALQEIYGANTTTAAGDDTYLLEDVTGSRGIYKSIWDTGGTDAISYGGTDDVVIDLRPATLQVEDGGGGFISHATTVSRGGYSIAADVVIENASSGSGSDTITGNDVRNTIASGDGDDVVSGGQGNDILLGGNDNDTLTGDDGNDVLAGEAGNDHLFGGDGDDALSGGTGADTVDGGAGTLDIVSYADATAGVVFDFVGGTSSGEFVNDVVTGVEGFQGARDFANGFVGGTDREIFLGGFQGDVMLGGGGADILVGDQGVDTLDGGDGADVILGSRGADILRGGGADGDRDLFVFNGNDDTSTIEDFQVGEDLILIQRTGLSQTSLVFSDNAGGVLVSLTTGNTQIQVDGASQADLTADANLDGLFDHFAFV